MNNLKVGYSSINVNPPLNYPIHGYYLERFGKGFIDDLIASAIALYDGKNTALIISVDNGGFTQNVIAKFLDVINLATDVNKDNIFISATHSHTAPTTFLPEYFEVD